MEDYQKNKINMYYVGDTIEYDSIEELCADNADVMGGTWQAVVYEAYEGGIRFYRLALNGGIYGESRN